MYQLGYYEHYLDLKRKYPEFVFAYPKDWTLKEYGTLFIFDLIIESKSKRVLEVGCGYDTFFAKQMAKLGIEYWYIDRSNDYLGIGQDVDRYKKSVEERNSYGAKHIDDLLRENIPDLPSDYFDVVFSISCIEHIDNKEMPAIAKEIERILLPGGRSVHSVDIYVESTKAKAWHESTCLAKLDVPLPHNNKWEFSGARTTFLEQPKIRYLTYNSLKSKDPLMDGLPYHSQFATMLNVAVKTKSSIKQVSERNDFIKLPKTCPVCASPFMSWVKTLPRKVGGRVELFYCMECKSFSSPFSPPKTNVASPIDWHKSVLQRNLGWSSNLLQQLSDMGISGPLLEIGCGIGSLLLAAKDRGMVGVGFDLNPIACEYGRSEFDLDLRAENWSAEESPDFGLIACISVLEHIHQPRALIREMIKAAKEKAGKIFISVPFFEKNRWHFLQTDNFEPGHPFEHPHDHVTHFSYHGLEKVCRQFGASDVKPLQVKNGWAGIVVSP